MLKNNTGAAAKRKYVLSDRMAIQASLAICAFVLIQTLAFPNLGIYGAVVAGQCAAMPWFLRVVRSSGPEAWALLVTATLASLGLSVAFSYAPALFKLFMGGV